MDELGVRSVSAINETGINAAHVAASAGLTYNMQELAWLYKLMMYLISMFIGNVDVLRMLHSKHKKLLHQRAADGMYGSSLFQFKALSLSSLLLKFINQINT